MLSAAGIPAVVMFGPAIPALNDMEIEAMLKAAAVAGVKEAGYTHVAAAARNEGHFPGMADDGNAGPGLQGHGAGEIGAERQGK